MGPAYFRSMPLTCPKPEHLVTLVKSFQRHGAPFIMVLPGVSAQIYQKVTVTANQVPGSIVCFDFVNVGELLRHVRICRILTCMSQRSCFLPQLLISKSWRLVNCY